MLSFLLLAVLIISTLVPSSNATNTRELVGGYGPIPDLEDPMVVNAAKFAFLELFAANEKPYDFVTEMEGDHEAFVPLIVAGSEQVVAGLNLKLTLMIQKVDESSGETFCRGAMEVEVYLNLDQTMEVTEWGDEFTCDEAQAFLEDRLKNEEKNGGN